MAPIIQKSLVGYCALRRNPWHFVGIYATREEAEQWAKMAGNDHEVAFGAYRERSDDFVALRPDQEIDYGIDVSPE